MRKILIALLILGGCSDAAEQGSGNASAPPGGGQGAAAVQGPPGAAITTLTGLYEGGGEAGPKNQLCMVDPKGETARFGLVVWGAGQHSCSGSGTAARRGDRLQLKMAGDEACTIDARIAGLAITLPKDMPDGCAYYCGARARLGGASFTQIGTGRDDAAKAEDLVGDPLC